MPTRKLLAGYRRFKSRFAREEEVFRRLAEEGQDPKVLWIGCSDSRVIPELITGAEAGELFDVRNIANVVPPAGSPSSAAGAAVEFAVINLRVRHIVVCGHTECGGIMALESTPDPDQQPDLGEWLDLIRPAREKVLDQGVPQDQILVETIKANVLLQCSNLRTYQCVADREGTGDILIHAWVYDLHTGGIVAYDPPSEIWNELAGPGDSS